MENTKSPAEGEKGNEAQERSAAVGTNGAAAPVTSYLAGIDIVKILAVFLVVCMHFFLYNGFYDAQIMSKEAYGPIAFRWLTYTCFPLLMIYTGYIMKNKTFSAKFYKGLIKIIVIYIFISILCIKFKEHHFDEKFDAWKILKGYFEFNNAQYGWYINYYIAIFLIIPFLNLAFNGCKDNKQKLFLTAAVFTITILARSLFMGFTEGDQIRVFPDYLSGAWPVAYYFTGAFIHDRPPKRTVRNKLVILGVLVLAAWFITWSSYNQSVTNEANDRHFISWHFSDYGTYPVFVMAVCIFLLLFDITTKNKRVKWGLQQVSGVTLALYLMSYIFDNMFYGGWQIDPDSSRHQGFNEKYYELGAKLEHWYEVIPKVFICSLISAIVIHKLYDLCEYLFKQGVEAIKAEMNAREKK